MSNEVPQLLGGDPGAYCRGMSNDWLVDPPPQVRVVLDLDVAQEPIRGSITVADQPIQPFFGWIELASGLEMARSFPLDVRLGTTPCLRG